MPSFDMLCNLAEIKMLPQRTLLLSNSTFSHKIWIYLVRRLGVSRSHSVREKSTVLNVYIVRILTRNGLILPEATIERLIDYTQIV